MSINVAEEWLSEQYLPLSFALSLGPGPPNAESSGNPTPPQQQPLIPSPQGAIEDAEKTLKPPCHPDMAEAAYKALVSKIDFLTGNARRPSTAVAVSLDEIHILFHSMIGERTPYDELCSVMGIS